MLKNQATYANKYDGFTWNLNSGAWTPGESSGEVFFRPSPEQWDNWSRQDGNSVIEDIQRHIDSGKLWFTVGFGYLGGEWPCPNLRLSDNYSNPASIYMEVVTDDVLLVLVPEKNLGSGGEGGETTPMTCQPVNFATGNKYKKETDLHLPGPGLPLTYSRHYNSQSNENGVPGYGWTGSFSETVRQADGKMILRQADGADVHFTDDGQGKYVAETGRDRVIEAVSGGWKLTEPDSRTLEFDAEGRLVLIRDRNGSTQTLGYGAGNLSYAEDNYGRRLDFAYNADGHLQTLTTPVGDFTYTYSQDNLVSVTKPDTKQRTYLYADPHDSHNLTGITDENGKSAAYAYDDQDRAVASERIGGTDRITVSYGDGTSRTVTDSQGKSITYELQAVNGVGRIASSSGACGSCPGSSGAQFALNAAGQVETRTDPPGNITAYTYNSRGNMLTKTEAAGTSEERITTYTYHADYNLATSVTRASVANPGQNAVTAFVYDAAGNLTGITESGFSGTAAVSRTTSLSYDASGRLAGIDGPRTDVSDTVTFEYYLNDVSEGADRGMLKKVTGPLGHGTLSAQYNAYGKPARITDANGAVTDFVYDVSGRVSSKTSAGYTGTFEYDDAGNLTVLHLPGGRNITYSYTDAGQIGRIGDASGNYISYSYDSRGGRTREEIHDSSGALKKYTDFAFDDFERLSSVIYPGNYSENAVYDADGNLTQASDADGKISGYAYDHLNRLLSITQSGNVITAFAYDRHDNLLSVTDAENNATAYVYDDLGRTVSVSSPDSGVTGFGYDAAGNVVSRTDGRNITVTCGYDALNRRTALRFPDASQNIVYGYGSGENGKGRLTSMSGASGQTVYAYNALGQLTQETRTAGGLTFVTQYHYDTVTGDPGGMTYPGGMTLSYQRDAAGQIIGVSADGQPVAMSVYYLPFGPAAGQTFGNSLLSVSRLYDERYLLKRNTAGEISDYVYTHDGAGNILSVSGVLLPDVPEAAGLHGHEGNRITQSTGSKEAVYVYDGHGNIVSDGTRTFEYNQNNRLIRVSRDGSVVGEYFYDGQGRRVKKLASGVVTLYHYDYAGNLIAETDGSGTPLRDYVYLNGERVAMRIYGPQAGWYYFVNDHLGTPQKIVSASGEVVWAAAYLPFGEAQIVTEIVANNFRFPGQYYDAESGLHYNWNRYYDPKTGRYLTPDPIGLEGGVNLYAYVDGNPVNASDPSGLYAILLIRGMTAFCKAVMFVASADIVAEWIAHMMGEDENDDGNDGDGDDENGNCPNDKGPDPGKMPPSELIEEMIRHAKQDRGRFRGWSEEDIRQVIEEGIDRAIKDGTARGGLKYGRVAYYDRMSGRIFIANPNPGAPSTTFQTVESYFWGID